MTNGCDWGLVPAVLPTGLKTIVEDLRTSVSLWYMKKPVFQIRIRKIRKFLGHPDPDPSLIKQKY